MIMVQGEYWIADGLAIYADGDIGDINHEGLVIQHVFQELVSDISSSNKFSGLADIWESLSEGDGVDVIAAVEAMNNYADNLLVKGTINQDELDDIEESIRLDIDWPEDKLRVALGRIDDAREYGVKELKWIRVLNTNIQIYGLTRSRLKELADGLYECFQECWESQKYFIEDTATGKCYSDVPGHVIDSEDLGYLRAYERF